MTEILQNFIKALADSYSQSNQTCSGLDFIKDGFSASYMTTGFFTANNEKTPKRSRDMCNEPCMK
jgi:hypothetical protein